MEVVFSLLHDHPHTCVAEAPLLYLVDLGAAIMADVAPEDAAPASTATVSHSKAEQQQVTQQLDTQQACTDTAGAPEITFKVCKARGMTTKQQTQLGSWPAWFVYAGVCPVSRGQCEESSCREQQSH